MTKVAAGKLNNLTREEARTRAGVISETTYDVALDFTQGETTFGCETLVAFSSPQGSSTFLDYTGAEVTSITLNGRNLETSCFDGYRIQLTDLAERNEIRVSSQSSYMNTGTGVHRFVDPIDGSVYLHTQFEPFDANRVFPCFDQPDIKATFDFSVTAPAGWEVICCTPPNQKPSPTEGGVWRFETTKIMSTYITAIVAGPFEVLRNKHGQIDLGLYCRKSLLQYLEPDAEEIFEITKQGFDFFEEAFAYPYPFGKYDQLFVPEFNAGAMENAGAVTFNESMIYRSRVTEASRQGRAGTILHEMAHMWFGDLVTMKWWDDLWLNESFATYQGTLAVAEATRFKQAWTGFAQGSKGNAYAQDQLPTTHPIVADIPDIESTNSNFDGITYSKGASVLKQLVAWVGREAFDEGIRNYFVKHAFGNTDLDDFLKPLEETSGRDLQVWSKEWLESAGVNTMFASFDTQGSGISEKIKSFHLVQEAPEDWPTLRSHRIAIGLYDDQDGRLVRVDRVELDAVGSRTSVPALIGTKRPALILLNDDDLAYTKIRLDFRSLETVVQRGGQITESLPRALCWSATWSMVRDAQMRARDYLQMVLTNVHGETEIDVVQGLLGNASSAVVTFGDPANCTNALEQLADSAHRELMKASPGSDLQRAWAGAFIGAARSPRHIQLLQNLLDGTASIDGLAVDIGLRWHIIGALVGTGNADDALIDTELKADPTDMGKRNAISCRVAKPTPEAKAEGWATFVEDDKQPLATLRSVAGGFKRHDQVELIRPYVEKFFEELPRIWETRQPEVSRLFAGGMFPGNVVEEGVVKRIDSYIKDNDPPFPLRRTLLEAKDGLLRSLKARAKDAQTK